MNDGQLSQEEIDALLGKKRSADHVTDKNGGSSETDGGNHAVTEEVMSEMEGDVLGEIGNISFGSAATALSTILNQKVEITTPEVSVVNRNDLDSEFPIPNVSVLVKYTSGFEGSCVLIIKIQDACVIADLMMGGDGKNPSTEINDMQMSAIQEAMNQMMGYSSTALSTVFDRRIDISPPELTILDVKSQRGLEAIPEDEIMFEVSFRLKIGKLVDSHIMQLVPIPFGRQLVDMLLKETGGQPPHSHDGETDEDLKKKQVAAGLTDASPAAANRPAGEAPGASRKAPQATDGRPVRTGTSAENKADVSENEHVHPADFSDFDAQPEPEKARPVGNLDLLMDIPLDVSVELGHTQKTVKEVLELGPGSIIELDKLAGEAIDILVNQKYVAKGEVVVVDENFGIRITEILNHYDRIKNL